MSDAFRIIHTTSPTSTGVKTYTDSGFGTCVGAIVIFGLVTAEDTQRDHVRFCVGMTDFTRERVAGVMCEHTSSSTDAVRFNNSKFIMIRDTDGSSKYIATAVDGSSGPVTDGCEINWTTVDSGTPYQITVILLGTDAAASDEIWCQDFKPTPADTAFNVTQPGFQADWVIGMWNSSDVPANGNHAYFTLGVAAWNGASWDHFSWGIWSDDNVSTSYNCSAVWNDSLVAPVDDSGNLGKCPLTAQHANGFTATPAVGYGNDVMYLCGKNPTGRTTEVADFLGPTATGTWTNTSFSQEGDALLLLGQRLTSFTANTSTTSTNNWIPWISCVDKVGTEKTAMQASSRNNMSASTWKNRQFQGSTFIVTKDHNETTNYDIDTHAFTSTGWTANVNTEFGAAVRLGALMFAADAAETHEVSGSLGGSLGLSGIETLQAETAGSLGVTLDLDGDFEGSLAGAGTFPLSLDWSGDSITTYEPAGSFGVTLDQVGVAMLGDVYYALDPTSGNDGTAASSDDSATAQTTPWKTFAALDTALVEPVGGDAHIIVKAGETVSGASELTKDGTSASERIVIGSYGAGAKPLFDGGTNTFALRVRNWTHVTDQIEITSTAGDGGRKAVNIPSNEGEGITVECDIDGAAGVQIVDSGTSAGVTVQNNTIITSDGDCVSILSNSAGTVTMQDATFTNNGGTNADCWQAGNAATCPVVARRLTLNHNHILKQAVTIGGALTSMVCEELDFYTTVSSGTRPDGFVIRNSGGDYTCKGFRFHDEYEICFRVTDEVGGLQGDVTLQGAYLLQREGSTSPCLRVDEDAGNLHGTHNVVFSNVTIPQGNNCLYVAVDNASPSWTLRYENCIFQQTTTTGGGRVMRLGGAGSLLPNLSSACNNNILKGATHASGTYILSNGTEHTTLSAHQSEFSIQGIDDASADETITFRDGASDDYTPDAPSAAYQGGKAVGGGSVYYDLTTVTDPENIGSHPGGWAFVHDETGTLATTKTLSATDQLDAELAASLGLDQGLAGELELSAEVSGTLNVSSGLTGESQASLVASGSLDLSKGLSGVATAFFDALGTLPITATLAGAGGALLTATGTLSITLDQAGDQAVTLESAGTLAVTLDLAGSEVRAIEGAGLLGGTFTVSGVAALAVTEGDGTLGLSLDLSSATALDAETGASLGLTLDLSGAAESLGLLDGVGTFALELSASAQALAIYEAAAEVAAQLSADAVTALITDSSGTLAAQLGVDSTAGLDLLESGLFALECDLVADQDGSINLGGTLGLQVAATAGAIATYAPGGNLSLALDLIGSAAGPLTADGTLGLDVGQSGSASMVTALGATLSVAVDVTGNGTKFSTTIETAAGRRIVIRTIGRQIIIRGGSTSV